MKPSQEQLDSIMKTLSGTPSIDESFHVPGQAPQVVDNSKETSKPADNPTSDQETIKTPAQIHRERMEEQYKFTEDELNKACDELMFKGVYEESFDIRGKFRFTLASRSVGDMDALSAYMDKYEANTFAAYRQHESLATLAFSLVNLNGRDLHLLAPVNAKAGENSRLDLILKIPGPILGLILKKLDYLDFKVMKAFEEADEAF